MTKNADTIEEAVFDTVAMDDPEFLRHLVERALQRFLEAEMTAHLGAARYERSDTRQGHRNGYKPRQLHTRVGTLTLRVPQDREGTFSTQLFARYQRSEKALILGDRSKPGEATLPDPCGRPTPPGPGTSGGRSGGDRR